MYKQRYTHALQCTFFVHKCYDRTRRGNKLILCEIWYYTYTKLLFACFSHDAWLNEQMRVRFNPENNFADIGGHEQVYRKTLLI